MVRTLLVGLLLVGAGCPGPKVEPAAAATAEVPLEGGWFLLDTPLGPPSALAPSSTIGPPSALGAAEVG